MIFERKKKTLAACEKRAKRERETKKGKKKKKEQKIFITLFSRISRR
jgi:hypothetical protein